MHTVDGAHGVDIPTLREMGNRICIIGMSTSGKSTLATVLSKKLQLPVCFLDTIAHIPHTAWVPKDKEALKQEHDGFLKQHTAWVIEGNYQFLMPQRFQHATAVIWLDYPPITSAFRHIQRAFQKKQMRFGNLAGSSNQLQWKSIHHILFKAPKNRDCYRQLIEESNKPVIYIRNFHELHSLYHDWELTEIYQNLIDV